LRKQRLGDSQALLEFQGDALTHHRGQRQVDAPRLHFLICARYFVQAVLGKLERALKIRLRGKAIDEPL
jgi:hypothetical protein